MISLDLRILLDTFHKHYVPVPPPKDVSDFFESLPVYIIKVDRTGMLPIADKAEDDGEIVLSQLMHTFADSRFEGLLLATGSRVYGSWREDSDYDLVVYTSNGWTVEQFRTRCDPSSSGKTCGPPDADYPEYRLAGSYRFGPLNVIHCDKRTQWTTWVLGTTKLIEDRDKLGPRSRIRAIQVFTEMGQKYCGHSEKGGVDYLPDDRILGDDVSGTGILGEVIG